MTTASTAQGSMMGSSGSDENKIKIAPSVKNCQSNMHSKRLSIHTLSIYIQVQLQEVMFVCVYSLGL